MIITLPQKIKSNDIIEVKCLISHIMESGYRREISGKFTPRDIITLFTVSAEGKVIFTIRPSPAIAANPYFSFFYKAEKSGNLDFHLQGDNGYELKVTKELVVE